MQTERLKLFSSRSTVIQNNFDNFLYEQLSMIYYQNIFPTVFKIFNKNRFQIFTLKER